MTHHAQPQNKYVARGSQAEKIVRKRSGLPGEQPLGAEAIAAGLQPHPEHDLRFHHGKTIQDLAFTNFFINQPAWNIDDIQLINQALAEAMSDEHLNNVMRQYFDDQPITSTFIDSPTPNLLNNAPSIVSRGNIDVWVRQLFQQGVFADFDLASTVFNFLLPRGIVLTDNDTPNQEGSQGKQPHHKNNPIPHEEEASSLEGLGGYHGSVHVMDQNVDHIVYFAIGVYSEHQADGTDNGIPVFDASWKNIVATFYHELNEARTDADVEDAIRAGNDPSARNFLGWVSEQGEECGDFPVLIAQPLSLVFKEVPLTNGDGPVPVQFQFSDTVHGPEGPILQPSHP